MTLYESELKLRDSYGAIVKIGALFDKALPYISLGVVTTKVENRLSRADGTVLVGESKKIKRSAGFECGFGVDVPVSERIALGIRYAHVEYSKFSGTFNITAAVPRQSFEFKPRTNAFFFKCEVPCLVEYFLKT